MTITEVSKKLDMTADTLRYYERIGLIPAIKRNKSGIRVYDEHDVKRIEFIKCMRGAGLHIETLIEYFALFEKGDETIASRKELLIEERDKLGERIKELQSTLDRLNYKIEVYEEKTISKKHNLVNT